MNLPKSIAHNAVVKLDSGKTIRRQQLENVASYPTSYRRRQCVRRIGFARRVDEALMTAISAPSASIDGSYSLEGRMGTSRSNVQNSAKTNPELGSMASGRVT